MIDFLKFILENIVDNPDKLLLEESNDDIGEVIIIKSSDSDKALIIGRNGKNIKAIRALCFAYAKKNNVRSPYIKILD